MARRSDHSREELRDLVVEVATQLVAKQGMAGLNARAIAAEIGYSPGTLYNVFGNLDEISLEVARRTMILLRDEGRRELTATEPREGLRQLARCYLRFTHENAHLWHLVRTRRWPQRNEIPAEYRALVMEVLAVLESAFGTLFLHHEIEQRRWAALTLWASMDGITALSGAGSLIALPERRAIQLVDQLVDHFVSGVEREREQVRAA